MAGDENGALQEFQQALKRNPKLVAPNLFSGRALFRLGRANEAIPYLDRACLEERRGVAPLLARAQVHVALRQYAAANKDYTEVVAREPSNAEGWFGIGITYRSMAESALKLSSRSPEAGRYLESAVGALHRAAALDPGSERVHLILGESLRDAGKLMDALEEYKKAVAIRPDSAAVHLGLAATYWKAGEIDTVLPPLRRALELAPRDPDANGIMADLLVRQGDYVAARKYVEIALSGNPDLSHAHLVMGKILLSENRPDLAIVELKAAGKSDTTGSSYYLLHKAYKQTGDDAAAAAALREFERIRNSTARN
jgi:tetratricopeptide (TPR) repeat protein